MAYLSRVYIDKYRGIDNLTIDKLDKINLVVGDNNCGKTSVLEALELLGTSGDIANIYRIARQRDSLAIFSSNSAFDSFICMFPQNDNKELQIYIDGICDEKKISFSLGGVIKREIIDPKDFRIGRDRYQIIPTGETEVDVFEGSVRTEYGKNEMGYSVFVSPYSRVSRAHLLEKKVLDVVYVAPFEHMRGNIIGRIVKNDAYKNVCINALKLFDQDIEDMMVLRNEISERPVDYLKHKKLGLMPISSYGDGIKKVLVLANAIVKAADGILLIDEIETALHKKYYDDIFRFIVKACNSFNVQAFITTHSIEAIDGLLATQDYETQSKIDDISVCTIKKSMEGSFSRTLSGREVFEDREAFGFEVRL